MTSRLDRLVELLHNGSNKYIRSSAAQQIAEVCRHRSDNVQIMCDKVLQLMTKHKSIWSTRVSCAQAIGMIFKEYSGVECQCLVVVPDQYLSLSDLLDDFKFRFSSYLDEDTDKTVDELSGIPFWPISLSHNDLLSHAEALRQIDCEYEIIALGQKDSKSNVNQGVDDIKSRIVDDAQESLVIQSNIATQQQQQIYSEDMQHQSYILSIYLHCLRILESRDWEIRHGSVLIIKSILESCSFHRLFSQSFFIVAESQIKENGLNTDQVLEQIKDLKVNSQICDIVSRLISVLAKDRFADYQGDLMVVPVRESAGQCLSLLIQLIDYSKLENVQLIFDAMINIQKDTGTSVDIPEDQRIRDSIAMKISASIALKYFLAGFSGRIDLLQDVQSSLHGAVVQLLSDTSDDVRAIVSSAISPLITGLQKIWSQSQLTELLILAFDIIEDYDDIGAYSQYVIQLIQNLIMADLYDNHVQGVVPVQEVVHRIIPYIRHNSSSVRLQILSVIEQLIQIYHAKLSPMLSVVLNSIIYTVLLDTESAVQQKAFCVITSVILKIQSAELKAQICKQITQQGFMHWWMYVISTPSGICLPVDYLPDFSRECHSLPFMTSGKISGIPPFSAHLSVQQNQKHIQNLSLLRERQFNPMDIAMITHDLEVVDQDTILRGRFSAVECLSLMINSVLHEDGMLQVFENICQGLLSTSPFTGASSALWCQYLSIILTTCYDRLAGSDVLEQYLAVSFNLIWDQVSSDDIKVAFAQFLVCNGHYQFDQSKNEHRKLGAMVKCFMSSMLDGSSAYYRERCARYFATFLAQSINYEQFDYGKMVNKVIDNLFLYYLHDQDHINVASDAIYSTSRSQDAVMRQKCIQLLFSELFRHFDGLLLDKCPQITQQWPNLSQLNIDPVSIASAFSALQIITKSCSYLRVLSGIFDSVLLQCIVLQLQSPYSYIRWLGAQTVEVASSTMKQLSDGKQTLISFILTEILPLLDQSRDITLRIGIAGLIQHFIQKMQDDILPYLVYFIVPVLRSMNDQHSIIRNCLSSCFAELVRLMPLESGAADLIDLSDALIQQKENLRSFVVQLLNPSQLEDFQIPVQINAQLRRYQQDGLNWLYFLNKYNLHGILCDDMGLGKTLQTICILASDHHHRSVEQRGRLPSLVICPTSVTGHWKNEILRFTQNLKPVIYYGTSAYRRDLMDSISQYDILIISYEMARNDIDLLTRIQFNYCVLDEGHIIKNAKSKTTMSIKQLRADHRLILSGTPVQNNVLELWSLFDFLMPGFLGSEEQFRDKYAKPILAMKSFSMSHFDDDGKASKSSAKRSKKRASTDDKVEERGILALESLHKLVLPFLLRRLKEDVLHDLPPKIIQDYPCELTDLQRMIYDQFCQDQFKSLEDVDAEDGNLSQQPVHIFQALQFLRKLCNHPMLVAKDMPKYQTVIQNYLHSTGIHITDVNLSGKLLSLRELLLECGIGSDSSDQALNPHRALIFCQQKSMVDLIENVLFGRHMQSVSYMRLDGSVPAMKRQDIVSQFNLDPSIDVLLLTTSVGGLGLNLTGADTVIFVEHDYNPSKDMQAMDRAHRIGQQRTVNVYRLITKDTLEEKIMGLQKFKKRVADAIINEENSGTGLQSMQPDEILSVFETTPAQGAMPQKRSLEQSEQHADSGKSSKKSKHLNVPGLSADVVAHMEQLAEQSQDEYNEAYNFEEFLSSQYSSQQNQKYS
ncbi:hypothetical protein MP228_002637 [Amoeboaphelidium protococcarum]|nr:hypothetical protein MP228_002637 [Amoeboaphelidium protococcarum]